MSSFVISDIHGCLKSFQELLSDKLNFSKNDCLYLLGDYIDRGPDSKGVIDHILLLKEQGFTVETLLGNHEQMLIDSFEDPFMHTIWIRNGGDATLKSFEANSINDIPGLYIDFFRNCKRYIELEDFLLVHAGFNFSEETIYSDEYAMIWARNYRVFPEKTSYKVVVHGHTPRPLPELFKKLTDVKSDFEINIDNGCVYKEVPLGNLLALELDNLNFYVQPNLDF